MTMKQKWVAQIDMNRGKISGDIQFGRFGKSRTDQRVKNFWNRQSLNSLTNNDQM